MTHVTIKAVTGHDLLKDHLRRELATLLKDCVYGGASIGYVVPFSLEEADDFWQQSVAPKLDAGTRLMWIAEIEGKAVGSVQLDIDTFPNGPHRADVLKLMVHPDVRRRGLARGLMKTAEAHALSIGRTLLTLDTQQDSAAEPLYASLGYVTVGPIPGYCLDPLGSGRLDATVIMFKNLADV